MKDPPKKQQKSNQKLNSKDITISSLNQLSGNIHTINSASTNLINPQIPDSNTKHKSIEIQFCNIRSLSNKIDLVKDYVEDNMIDIIFLTETSLSLQILTPILMVREIE